MTTTSILEFAKQFVAKRHDDVLKITGPYGAKDMLNEAENEYIGKTDNKLYVRWAVADLIEQTCTTRVAVSGAMWPNGEITTGLWAQHYR